MTLASQAGAERIVLFDGVCNLCAWAVQFIIKRDSRGVFKFAALQSEAGQRLLLEHGYASASLDSFVLIEAEGLYVKSEAALRVARHLSGFWPLCYGALILPWRLRDAVYGWIARNRYRWFGKQESCLVPTPEWRARIIE
ncbi:MAG: thiol-disulfide oxidoreductase DCC family protein [Roseimicrobium sp.]